MLSRFTLAIYCTIGTLSPLAISAKGHLGEGLNVQAIPRYQISTYTPYEGFQIIMGNLLARAEEVAFLMQPKEEL